MSYRKKNRKKKKRWLVPVCAGGVTAAVLAGMAVHAVYTGRTVQTGTVAKTDTTDPDTVIWQGKEYVYNDDLSNYLMIGVDKEDIEETSAGQANAGQADAIYLVVRDRRENTVTLISIPRDTMTEIELIAPGGESLGTDVNHINLSYAYGDGAHESCRLTEEAVSNLLYGIPIQSYCAVSMEALPILTESVGSLTVTVPNDSMTEDYPDYAQGEEITLTPENTEIFVRYRNTAQSQSALDRLERQQEFLKSYGEAAKQKYGEDPQYAVDLYEALPSYMMTSMGSDEFVRLAESLATGNTETGWTIPGEGVEGADYDEYHVDDDALYEKIIETFYKEAGS